MREKKKKKKKKKSMLFYLKLLQILFAPNMTHHVLGKKKKK